MCKLSKVDVYEIEGKCHPDDPLHESYFRRALKGVAVVHYVVPKRWMGSGFRLVIHKNKNYKGSEQNFRDEVTDRLEHLAGHLLQYFHIEYMGKKENFKYII